MRLCSAVQLQGYKLLPKRHCMLQQFENKLQSCTALTLWEDATRLAEQPIKGLVEECRLVSQGPLNPLGHQALG